MTAARTLEGELLHKAIAVRAQLQAYELEAQLALTRAELARERAAALSANVPALEAQCLAALGAPPGARFDWATFTAAAAPAEPPHAPAPGALEVPQ